MRVVTWALATLGTLALVAQSVAVAGDSGRRAYVVVYDTSPRAAFSVQHETTARERVYGFTSERRFRHAIDGFSAHLTPDQVRALRADPEVALVEAVRSLRLARVPLAHGETVPTGADRIGARNGLGVHQASGSAVAVLDTGIALSHPDLVARAGVNCTGDGPPQDNDGHGTGVAGVIGATNTGSGVVGVAPGTEVYAVKVVTGPGAGDIPQILCGVDWVTANAAALGIRVANMSLSGPVQSDALRMAIQRSAATGIAYVAAAGNSGGDVAAEIPGSYPEVLTVTAMSDSDGAPGGTGPQPCWPGETDDTFATFSNRATRPEDAAHVVAAPGVCIVTTGLAGGEQTGTGTSFAAPHVAGVVALCMGEGAQAGACADMSAAEVIDQVRADAAVNATPENGFHGDPHWPVGPYFGHLVSAIDPVVRRIPRRAAPVSATAAPVSVLDRLLQVIEMRIKRRQHVNRLRVVARLGEAGAISATARIRFRARTARVIRSRPASAQLAPNRTRRLTLRLARADLRQVKSALRAGLRVRARITMTVSDVPGNARTKSRRVRLRR